MKSITIRDLRQRWPEAEAALQVEDEIIITRDSKPVAKLVRVVPETPKRKRWNPEEHKKWLKKVWGNKQVRLVDKYLQADREPASFQEDDDLYRFNASLLKLLWNEPESQAVIDAIADETAIVVSVLAELETRIQLKAAQLGGDNTLPGLRRFEAQLSMLRNQPPYEFRALPGAVFQTALRQHRNSGGLHCRSLDRLHLAAMEELEVSRLMTNDEGQAKAARQAGFEVVSPGRD